MADATTPIVSTPVQSNLIVLLIQALTTALAMIPPAQAEQVAMLAGEFIGQATKPTQIATVQQIAARIDSIFNDAIEIGKPNDSLQNDWPSAADRAI